MKTRKVTRRFGLCGFGFVAVWVGLVYALGLAAGCGAPAPEPAAAVPGASAAAGEKLEEYPLVGLVRKVEVENQHVTIKHEEIPGFMGAMTMRFALLDQPVIRELKPGDHVRGTLRVHTKQGAVTDYELVGLAISEHAAADGATPAQTKAQMHPPARRLEPGDPVPDFTMTTMEGRVLKLSELRGYVVVITFIYTRCPLPEFCPLMDRKFRELAEHVSAVSARAEKVRMISLSFDAVHDTPEVLRKHAAARGAIPPLWIYANAADAELNRIAGPLGLIYGENGPEFAHNLCTVVIDPDGKVEKLLVGTAANRFESADMIKTIRQAIAKSSPNPRP